VFNVLLLHLTIQLKGKCRKIALCVRVDTERADQSDKYRMELVLMSVF